MKKRLIALLIIVVMLTALVFTCISCSTGIFSKDDERDYYQVIATVKYGALSKDIYKGQLATYVNSYGAAYQSNYNMTIDEIVEYFYNTLTRSALLTLYAKYYVYDKAESQDADYSYIDTSKKIEKLKDKDFVSLQQYVYAIDRTNEDFISSFESILSGLEKKKDTDEDEDDTSDDEEELTPRTVRTYDDEDTSEYSDDLKCTAVAAVYGKQYEGKTYGEIDEDFIKNELGEASIDSFVKKIDAFNVISKKIAAEQDATKKKNMKSALKTLRENISKTYSSYEWFLEDNIESCIITALRDGLKNEQSSTDAQIEQRYRQLIEDNIGNLDEDTYSSAISGSTFLPVNASQDYAGVKSILLKFSDTQSAALTAIKATYGANEDMVAELRDAIALGTTNSILDNYGMKDNKGILVNVSNPFYDSDEDEIKDAYTDKDVNYQVILYCMADSIAKITADIADAYKATDEYKALNDTDKAIALAIVTYAAKVEAFTQWMYLVNDDSGMFSNESYTITPDEKDTSYVAEYTVLARKLAKQDIGAYTSSTYATGDLDSSVIPEEYGSGAYVATGKTIKIYKEADVTTKTTSDTLKANVYTIETEDHNTLSFIVNDYGIHIILVTEKYGCDNFVDDCTAPLAKDDNNGFKYLENAIYDRGTTIKYDYTYTDVAPDASYVEGTKYYLWDCDGYVRADVTSDTFDASEKTYYTREWEFKSVKCEYQTLNAYLDDANITALFSNKYSASQIALYLDIPEKNRHASINKVDKVYEALIKEFDED